ncbi:MAG: site-specific integrase [Candidatus Atribacteria bacterium]|nr:site-specific integrase [Candidatus Atribacteria bacterium]
MNLTDIQSPWKDILEDFFLTRKVNGDSRNTIEWYRYSIIPLIKSLNVPSNELEISHVRKHISELYEKGLKPASVETKVKAIKAFLNFLFFTRKDILLRTFPKKSQNQNCQNNTHMFSMMNKCMICSKPVIKPHGKGLEIILFFSSFSIPASDLANCSL